MITIQPYNPNQHYRLTNARGVEYRSSDLDNLIREFVIHTDHKAVSFTTFPDSQTNQNQQDNGHCINH